MVLEKRTSTSDNIELQEIRNGETTFPVNFPDFFESPRSGNDTDNTSTFHRSQSDDQEFVEGPSDSIRVGVYNQLSCDLENDVTESTKLNASAIEESILLSRDKETSVHPSVVTKNTITGCSRKRWMLWILIITLVVIVIPGILAAIIDSSLLRHSKMSNDSSTSLRIQKNSDSQDSTESFVLRTEKDLEYPKENRVVKYTLQRQKLRIPGTDTKTNTFPVPSRPMELPKGRRRIEFPIPDDETRQAREFKEEMRRHLSSPAPPKDSKEFQIGGTGSVEEAHIDDDINKIKMADEVTMNDGIKFGEKELDKLFEIEERIRKSGFTLPKRSPESFHQLFKKTSDQARQLSLTGFAMTKASVWMAQRLNMSAEEARHGIITSTSLSIQPNEWCEERAKITFQTCNKRSPYRTLDGTCNNLRNPTWGSAFQEFRRILIPDYADGITMPRVASDGSPLPNARQVSQTIILDKPSKESQASLIVPLWAQFIAYDLSNTVQSTGHDDIHISCCTNGTLAGIQYPECFPIYIDRDDTVNHRCTTFIRSASAPICHFGPREQFNEYTSYLDASNIYGSSSTKSKDLRTTDSGRLKVYTGDDDRKLLPVVTDQKSECSNNNDSHLDRDHPCFQSGDSRTNANLGLTSMQTLWVRQHNHIASILGSTNPNMTHTKLFEETRRIVIAQIQHITFNEFLPILLGPDLMNMAGLELLENGYYKQYDVKVDTTLSNVFATAANRYGVSMIHGLLQFIDSKEHGRNTDYRQSHNYFFNPLPLWQEGKLDAMLRGHFTVPAGKVDTYFTKQITEKMFRKDNYTYGLDIVAINVQRGRDHGIPSYTAWRNICGLTEISSFDDLNNIWHNETIRLVRQIYKSVHDIDLYVGGLAEKHVKSGLIGPTFGCLIADQFSRVRKGDRFWYEGDTQVKPFTPDQLREIRKTTLARIFCENGDELTTLQPNIFKQPAKENKNALCDGGSIPKIDYSLWKETDEKLNSADVLIIPYRMEKTAASDEDDPYANIMDTTNETDDNIM